MGPDFAELRVRRAIHTGEAEERDGDYFGPTVNRVARLLAAAHGGQVLLSLAAAGLVRDDLPGGVPGAPTKRRSSASTVAGGVWSRRWSGATSSAVCWRPPSRGCTARAATPSTRESGTVTYTSDKAGGPTAGRHTFEQTAFITRLVAHIPDKGQVLQRYYGYYANRTRGERRKAAAAVTADEPCGGVARLGWAVQEAARGRRDAAGRAEGVTRVVAAWCGAVARGAAGV